MPHVEEVVVEEPQVEEVVVEEPQVEEVVVEEPQVEEEVEKPRGGPEDWVDAIDAYINEHGGVVNQDFKGLGLIPEDVTAGERARMNEELADCFTKHKVTNLRVFYCSPTIIEPEEVQAQYEKYLNQEQSEADDDGGVPDEDIPDFEFGFGTL